jgi:hypothetical protein
LGNFSLQNSSLFTHAHEYVTNTHAKHERFFQNLLRSERVQSERFR